MAYLIDGNNLIGHLSSHLGLANRGSRSLLIGKLRIFQRMTRKRIVLVFDGPPPLEEEPTGFNDRFTILYAGPETNADTIIKDWIERQTDKRSFSVVSSDREIRNFAHSRGFKDIPCQEFEREMKKAAKEYRKRREMAKDHLSSTPLEIRLWNEVFGEKK